MIPAHYRHGMWRVQYIQKKCCLCGTYNAKSKAHSQLTHTNSPRLPSLLCQSCHDDMVWLPPALKLAIFKRHHHKKSALESTDTASSSTPSISQSFTSSISDDSINDNFVIQAATHHCHYARAAVIAFKHNEQVSALPILVHILRQLPRPKGCHRGNSVILATATTKARLSYRGANSVSTLAYYLSKHWDIPVWKGVSRVDNAQRQQGLDRQERLLNITNAFRVDDLPPVKRILLFDDVATTGTTLSALALTLKKADPSLKILGFTLTHSH